MKVFLAIGFLTLGMRNGFAGEEKLLFRPREGVVSVCWQDASHTATQSFSAHVPDGASPPAWAGLPVNKFLPCVDAYGQFKHGEWLGKTHSDKDLAEAREHEAGELKQHAGPQGWDRFGGWAVGPQRNATGRFRVEKIGTKWWMIDPDGRLFWSHGVGRVSVSCAETPLDGRKVFFEWLPQQDSPFALFYTTHNAMLRPYHRARGIQETYDFLASNIYRKYGERGSADYADCVHRRLKSWGMNTLANSSDTAITALNRTPYTDRFELHSPALAGYPLALAKGWQFKDPFHPDFRKDFRRQLLERKKDLNNPWCFGFLVDNVIKWGNPDSLAVWTLQSHPTQPAKIELVSRLKAKYGNIQKLNDAWHAHFAAWEDLLRSETPPPSDAGEDCRDFTLVMIDRYFRSVRDEFKEIAPDSLYLGCRFLEKGSEFALRIAAKYCDVLSFNAYQDSLDSFALPEGVDRPVLIAEFHFGALDRGQLNEGLRGVPNQEARGKAYEKYVLSALRHPGIIGAHWHQYGDQPVVGRYDGENFQDGLVDVCDLPYHETVAGIRAVGYQLYEFRNSR